MSMLGLTETLLSLQPEGQIWRFSVLGHVTDEATFNSNVRWNDPETAPIDWAAVQAAGNVGEDIVSWRQLRWKRDELLEETDWWMLRGNATEDQLAYRQALRDLPGNTDDPANPTWPTKPQEKDVSTLNVTTIIPDAGTNTDLSLDGKGTGKVAKVDDASVGGDLTVTGTVEPAGGTSAGDNAAIGYSSGDGLILTGQGGNNDVTIKNDTATDVLKFPTGQTDAHFGGNIVFATASKGVYLGVTSATAANLLDDYETGTWTATLGGSTTNPTSAVTASFNYTKIGNLVHLPVYFAGVNTTGAAGGFRITGIPFTASPAGQMTGSVTCHTGMTTHADTVNISPYIHDTYIAFYVTKSNAGWEEALHNATGAMWLNFSVTYRVA